jgi:hypothetical protein
LTQGNTDISTLAAEPSAYVDQALKVWDKKRSKLATKYLGRGIRKELNNRRLMNRMFPQRRGPWRP